MQVSQDHCQCPFGAAGKEADTDLHSKGTATNLINWLACDVGSVIWNNLISVASRLDTAALALASIGSSTS